MTIEATLSLFRHDENGKSSTCSATESAHDGSIDVTVSILQQMPARSVGLPFARCIGKVILKAVMKPVLQMVEHWIIVKIIDAFVSNG